MYILIYDILDVRFYEQYYAFSKVLLISFGAPFKDAKSFIERSITLRTVLYFYWFSAEYVYSLFHVFFYYMGKGDVRRGWKGRHRKQEKIRENFWESSNTIKENQLFTWR